MRTTLPFIAALLSSTSAFARGEGIKDFFNNEQNWIMILAAVLLIMSYYAVNRAFKALNEKLLKEQGRWVEPEEVESKLMRTLTAAVPVEREDEIMTDHDYDGIRELDNRLPPWWLYGFYISIIFAIVYTVRYQITGDGLSSQEEYAISMEEAEIAKAAYYERLGSMVDESNVTQLVDASALEAGAKVFKNLCEACHAPDGGGISGPNLTDEYWVNGGGIKNIFRTINSGGRPGTAMIAWGELEQLSPKQIQDVASFIMSLEGSSPANPKAPEGEIWTPEETTEGASEEATEETITEETETTEAAE